MWEWLYIYFNFLESLIESVSFSNSTKINKNDKIGLCATTFWRLGDVVGV